MKEGSSFKILELNGAGAEPGHIYDPKFSLFEAYNQIFLHLNYLSRISRLNKKRGHRYDTFVEGLTKIREIRAYNRRKGQ
jgi:hypothetical protein